jgi:hypothetical protein
VGGNRLRRNIVVGHSHFIRAFCAKYIPEELKVPGSTAARLGTDKLDNATCVGLQVEFDHGRTDWRAHKGGAGSARVTNVVGMFGDHFRFDQASAKEDAEEAASSGVALNQIDLDELLRAELPPVCRRTATGVLAFASRYSCDMPDPKLTSLMLGPQWVVLRPESGGRTLDAARPELLPAEVNIWDQSPRSRVGTRVCIARMTRPRHVYFANHRAHSYDSTVTDVAGVPTRSAEPMY